MNKYYSLFAAVVFLIAFSSNTNAQTPCIDGMVAGYPCENVDLWAYVPLNAMGGGGSTNDIWGWTDPNSKREFALVGKSTGTAFVEITNPGVPDFLGELPTHTSNSTWRDIKVYNNFAFIVSEAGQHGMQVFDLSQLLTVSSPQIFTESAYYDGFGHSHNIAINEDSGFAYSVGDNTANGGLNIIDISDPLNPTLAGAFAEDGYTHDCQVVNYHGPDSEYAGKEIAFAANEDHFTIVNVSDKTDCVMISDTYYEEDGYTHQCWLTEDHKFLIFGDELDELQGMTFFTRTYIYNVEDLENPVQVAIFEGPTSAIDHNLYTVGNMIYMSNYRSGLRIVDAGGIEDGNIIERAYFDCYPSNDDPIFSGSWSNYPYFPSGNIIMTSIGDGMFIVRPQVFNLDSDVSQVGCATSMAQFTMTVPTELSSTSYTLSVEGLPGEPVIFASTINIPGTTDISLSNLVNLPSGITNFQIILNGDYGQYIVPAAIEVFGPETPSGLSPDNGAELLDLQLSWNEAGDNVTSYDVVISENEDLSDPVVIYSTGGTSYLLTDLLNDGQIYYWSVTANNDCGYAEAQTMNFVYADDFVSVSENNIEIEITVFPNPTTGKIQIEGINKNSKLVLTDITGRIVKTITTSGIVDLTEFNKGVYFLQYKESKELIEKIILE